MLDSIGHCFGTTVDLELLKDILNMISNSIGGDNERLGDIVSAITFCQVKSEHRSPEA